MRIRNHEPNSHRFLCNFGGFSIIWFWIYNLFKTHLLPRLPKYIHWNSFFKIHLIMFKYKILWENTYDKVKLVIHAFRNYWWKGFLGKPVDYIFVIISCYLVFHSYLKCMWLICYLQNLTLFYSLHTSPGWCPPPPLLPSPNRVAHCPAQIQVSK